MSDTTNKHIGNLLANASDEALKEILEQYAKKSGINIYDNDWQEKVINRLESVINATNFDYEGNILEWEEDI
jgi:spore coat polysaccharide biosynthesis protein SpsF (cytidylyltransferase family)